MQPDLVQTIGGAINPTVTQGLNQLQQSLNTQNQPVTPPVVDGSVTTNTGLPGTPAPVQKPKARTPITQSQPVEQPIEEDNLFGQTGMKRVGSDDILGKPTGKALLEQRAEKKGMVEDGSVKDQEKLNQYAVQRASENIKNMSLRGEKIDEDRLEQVFDRILGSIGVQRGSDEYLSSLEGIRSAYQKNIADMGYSSIDEALLSHNKKYNDFAKLKDISSNQIARQYSAFTQEQKDFLKVNNPVAYEQGKKAFEDREKAKEQNKMITGEEDKVEFDAMKEDTISQMGGDMPRNKATADYDSYINTADLKKAGQNLTKRDNEIVELQMSLEPETLKKEIMGRYGTALSTSALNALYYDESNDRQNTLRSLLGQKEMAMQEYNRIREENLERYKVVKQNEDQLVSTLMANGAMGLASLSAEQINQYVADGFMTESTAKALKAQQTGMLSNTLQGLGVLTPETRKKIEQLTNSGMSPSSILSELINGGYYQAPISRDRKIIKNADGSHMMVDLKSNEIRQIGNMGASAGGLDIVGAAQMIPDGPSNYNCATFINAVTRTATGTTHTVGTTIQDKIAKIDRSAGPVPGAVMVISGTQRPNGHVAIVESVLPDGRIQIREANYNGKGGVRSTIIDPNNPGKAYGIANGVRIEGYQIPKGLNQTKGVFEDPTSDTLSLILSSKGGKTGTEAERSSLTQIGEAFGSLSSLSSAIQSYQKGRFGANRFAPIVDAIQSKNPRNDKRKEIESRMVAIIPSIARGIFGEKGVLTDNDYKNYMKTLPKLSNTANANDLIMLVMMGGLKNSLSSKLEGHARNNLDVSRREGGYRKLLQEIEALEDKLIDKSQPQNTSIYTL